MKYLFVSIFCLIFLQTFGQNPLEDRFHKVSSRELTMETYSKDLNAVAVVLDEQGKKTFEFVPEANDIYTTLHYYSKIKILKAEGIEYANIVIPYVGRETIINIKAVTHNTDGTTDFDTSQIIHDEISDGSKELKILLPNVKVGSVIEYQYSLVSPYAYAFRPWMFQSTIPKVRSEFNAKIPSNYRFLRTLKGNLSLDVNTAFPLKNCFTIPELKEAGTCEVSRYVMLNVPAFDEENFSLSYENYIARIEFKLVEYKSFRIFGIGSYGFIDTWEKFDTSIMADDFNIKSILKKNMFKSFLPKELLTIAPRLEKAQKIYQFIRDLYTWNGELGGLEDNNLRKAFRNKSGSVSEINLSLMSALQAANLHAEVLLVATRNRSIPTLEYPEISDFNHMIVKTIVDGKVYFLDATDKNAPFGVLPVKALNYKGRALDFVAESYWETITPYPINKFTTSVSMKLEEDGTIKGQFQNASTGHIALNYRTLKDSTTTKDYLNSIESEYENLEITDYKLVDKETAELPLKESFTFEIDKEFTNTTLFLDPFVYKIFPKNPFTLQKREYPVDFAYPRFYTTRFMISLPEKYEFESIPKNQIRELDGKKAVYQLTTLQKNENLTLTFTLLINHFHFVTEEYEVLKSFFRDVVKIQKNTLLTIKKKNS
ncbi:uncharacterized protein DUF3857 [Kordia periserrulae]|uniref:Uncharacterized protein DUF3857 n=1 Tax=Kordia periserrulae TaxID=701523 RepID=A0A2T6BUR1_9FLAO|nr:DUF3857 domain-containing protein [Kordia periserrulae]PTX59717.1 uncharacterized protein DUF3857 [Kordia periserrulae]